MMNNIKNKNYAFRISESDLLAIKKKAKKAKLTVTDYITKTALDKKITVIEGLNELRTELKRIGSNINQLSMLCHQGVISTVRLNETESLLGDITIELKKIVKAVNSDGSA